MKNDVWNWLLIALLFVSALSAAVLAYTYSNYRRRVTELESQARQLEFDARQYNQDIAKMQALAAEVSEYAKKNPAIGPILRDLQEGRVSARPATPTP